MKRTMFSKSIFKTLLVVLPLSFVIACGDDDDDDDEAAATAGTETTTCTIEAAGFVSCSAYTEISSALKTELDSNCTDTLSGTVAATCPTENALGSCTVPAEGSTPAFTQTYYPDYTAEAGQTACESEDIGGTWTAASSS